MSDRHVFNGGLISTVRSSIDKQSGVWSIGNAPSSTLYYQAPVYTINTTEIGLDPAPSTQGSNIYNYASRNVSLFYSDAYGTTTHLTRTTADGSYQDLRHITRDNGRVDGSSFLISLNNSKSGWYYNDFLSVKGFEYYGKYSSTNSENQGNISIWGYDGSQWSVIEVFAGSTFAGISASGSPILFTGGAVSIKGIALSTATVSTYMPVNWFVGIFNDSNNYPIQGYTIS